MERRHLLSRFAALPLLASLSAQAQQSTRSTRPGALEREIGNPAIFVSLVEWADRVITE
jgi:hypothetical protein